MGGWDWGRWGDTVKARLGIKRVWKTKTEIMDWRGKFGVCEVSTRIQIGFS